MLISKRWQYGWYHLHDMNQIDAVLARDDVPGHHLGCEEGCIDLPQVLVSPVLNFSARLKGNLLSRVLQIIAGVDVSPPSTSTRPAFASSFRGHRGWEVDACATMDLS